MKHSLVLRTFYCNIKAPPLNVNPHTCRLKAHFVGQVYLSRLVRQLTHKVHRRHNLMAIEDHDRFVCCCIASEYFNPRLFDSLSRHGVNFIPEVRYENQMNLLGLM